jgi:hypothetical protein
MSGLELPEQTIDLPEGVLPVAWWALWGDWDPLLEFDIDNKEGNLASLIILENLPERIETAKGDSEQAWDLYRSLFSAYNVSDQGDFWAFFYQCWTILPLSLKLKLKLINLRLAQDAPLKPDTTPPTTDDFRYTPVLTKQSAMYNAWKLLREVAEANGIPVRLAPMYAYRELQAGTLKPDKARRYEAVSLQSFYNKIASS